MPKNSENPPRKRREKKTETPLIVEREPIEKSEDPDVFRELTPRPTEAIVELKARMIAVMKGSFGQWDENHPEWAADERHKRALQYSVFGLSEFFDILDEYNITYKE